MLDKTSGNKLLFIKKIFYWIDGFGEAFVLSKFLRIIRFLFISELSLSKARELAISKKILINDDIKKTISHTDWKVIIKEISVDLLKSTVESVFSKFVLIEFESVDIASLVVFKWSVFMRKNSVHKTYVISCNLVTYVSNRCVVICFDNEAFRLATVGSVSIFKGVNLRWTSLSLACCALCEQFGHVFFDCLVDKNSGGHEKKKHVLIAYSVSFSGRTWAQIASVSAFLNVFCLVNHLVSLKCSLELLADQVSIVIKKLSFVELVFLSSISYVFLLAASVFLVSDLNLNMIIENLSAPPAPFLPVVGITALEFGLSSLKVLTVKVDELKSKIVALEVLISSVLKRLDQLCSGLGFVALSFFQ
ncbi:hypothetical protein G9A89_023157 [Geosiphon pyriformis]|nr:hypothetical protein G9A89_023157 [Geosiphon pyriformis]